MAALCRALSTIARVISIPIDPTLGTNHGCGEERVEAGSRAEIEDRLTRCEVTPGEGIANAGKTLEHCFREGIHTLSGVAQPVRQEAAGVEVEAFQRAGGDFGVFLLNCGVQAIDVEQHRGRHHALLPECLIERRRAFALASTIPVCCYKVRYQFRIATIRRSNTTKRPTRRLP